MRFFDFIRECAHKSDLGEFNFLEIFKKDWISLPEKLLKVFQSSKFLVQVYDDRDFTRLSVSKVKNIGDDLNPVWEDGIRWDDLQIIKNAIGFEKYWCVECFPPEDEMVNVANFRHLWVLEKPPEFGWHYENAKKELEMHKVENRVLSKNSE